MFTTSRILTNQRGDGDLSLKHESWLGLMFIFLAVLIGLHQFTTISEFFQLKDALHHEFFMALFVGLGLGILIGAFLTNK